MTTLFALIIIVPQLNPRPKDEQSILIGLSPRIGPAVRVTISEGMLAPPRLPNSSKSYGTFSVGSLSFLTTRSTINLLAW